MFNSFEREHGSALAGRGVFQKHLLIVISFLLLGSLSAQADCWHFRGNGNHAVINHPSFDRPYLRFTAMFFDKTANNNGYFVKQKPTQNGAIPSSAADGPAIFIMVTVTVHGVPAAMIHGGETPTKPRLTA